jgi:acetyl esterase/lipase
MSTHTVTTLTDLEYATADGQSLSLDLHLPAEPVGPVPTLLYFHGGGWALGSRDMIPPERLAGLVGHGIALASASYRLAPRHTFPAQVHDVKAAVRWLRAHADEHGLDSEAIGAGGASAGGHLASMLGVTAGDADLEGTLGDHLDQPSHVGAVVAYFPTTDLVLSGSRNALETEVLPPSMPAGLLGAATTGEVLELARAASPRHRAHAGAAPHLLIHGDRDTMVPPDQSRLMHDALSGFGVDSHLLILGGAGHEGPEFSRPSVNAAVAGFLHEHLAPRH